MYICLSSPTHTNMNESTYYYTHSHLRVAFLGNHLLKKKGSNLLPALLTSDNPLLPYFWKYPILPQFGDLALMLL